MCPSVCGQRFEVTNFKHDISFQGLSQGKITWQVVSHWLPFIGVCVCVRLCVLRLVMIDVPMYSITQCLVTTQWLLLRFQNSIGIDLLSYSLIPGPVARLQHGKDERGTEGRLRDQDERSRRP